MVESKSQENQTDSNPKSLNVANDIQSQIGSKSNLPKKGYATAIADNILKDYPVGQLHNLASINYESPTFGLRSLGTSPSSYLKQLQLESEINQLKTQYIETYKKFDIEKKNKDKEIDELNIIKDQLLAKEKISHIISRICDEAREKILNNESFQGAFKDGTNCEAVVVSIDIRRSTELMLKSRKPELFSRFITKLSGLLSNAIVSNYGVFDKFTGDGILAFFPKFFSGESAILRAVKAAKECHEIFSNHYNESRDCFNVFIKDVGLGIGIDYGNVTLVNNGNELTVVGIPVVYACRMSGARAGETLLNQPAKEEILKHLEDNIKIIETEIDIKNEGTALAYKIEIFKDLNRLEKPEWISQELDDDKPN